MEVGRYRFPDTYTIAELRLEYEGRDPSERIELLESFYAAKQRPPYELALLAVQDASARVRYWLARNASDLDYREATGSKDDSGSTDLTYRYPDRDLSGRLAQDSDEVVRAGVLENPAMFGVIGSIFPWGWEGIFQNAGRLGRLAVMRNPWVSGIFVWKVFDPDDTSMGLDPLAREELVRAYFCNPGAIADAKAKHWVWNPHFPTLWKHLGKWPDPPRSGLKYLCLTIFGEAMLESYKAHFYQECKFPLIRLQFLDTGQAGEQALALALSDEDDDCREEAYSQIRSFDSNKFAEALVGTDKAALRGLSENKHLFSDDLKKLHQRLLELTGDEELSGACAKVEELIEEAAERERRYQFRHGWAYWHLETLFGSGEEQKPPEPRSLEERIELIDRRTTVIGRHLAQLAKNREERQRINGAAWAGFGRGLLWVAGLFFGFVLIRWLWRLIFS
jgi:hypothetical protein